MILPCLVIRIRSHGFLTELARFCQLVRCYKLWTFQFSIGWEPISNPEEFLKIYKTGKKVCKINIDLLCSFCIIVHICRRLTLGGVFILRRVPSYKVCFRVPVNINQNVFFENSSHRGAGWAKVIQKGHNHLKYVICILKHQYRKSTFDVSGSFKKIGDTSR